LVNIKYINFWIFNSKFVEGFDLNSLSSSTSTSSKPIPEQYQFIAPLPDGYAWSTETQDKWVSYSKKRDPNADADTIKAELAKQNSLMQMVSEEEVLYFIDKEMWPWDEYMINYFSSINTPTDQVSQLRKAFPNRYIYKMKVENETVPQFKIINDIFNSNSMSPNQGSNDKKWYCNYVSNGQQSQDHYDFNVVNGDETTTVTDYSTIPDIIQGLSFEGDACNICDMRKIRIDGQHDNMDVYNSSENKCKFKMSEEIPEAYNVYIGKYGNAPVQSTPASTGTSDNEYKKCISSCDTYK